MKFRSEFDIRKLTHPITHRHKLMLVGSCFTENITDKLIRSKFRVLQNPNGILFNPVSVAEAVTAYVEGRKLTEEDLFQFNDGWHSWNHHSRFSGITPQDALQKINSSTEEANRFLKEADYIFITLGSSWIYTFTDKAEHAKPGAVAANNHKAPAEWFHRRLMSLEEVLRVLDNMIHRLFLYNAKLKIIFTISPVRHLREGVVENNRSKAVLISAVHHLVDKFDRLHYFPAYELVIDDLRDYRFYAEDLVHPNYHATQYVWEKFILSCMDEETRNLIDEINTIILAYNHKPFNPSSEVHRRFLQSSYQKTAGIQERFTHLDFTRELHYFKTGSKD
jgi:hypothetical protein